MNTAGQFPPSGLVYFWFLNGPCRLEDLRRQIGAFARAGTAALVLHPRSGLLVPHGSAEWFELIRQLVHICLEHNIQPWLYDEDPYPSGSAGGAVVDEHPEWAAHGIERFEAPADLPEGELFFFPTGKLLWAGLVSADTKQEPVDLTARVGRIRRHWEGSPWDSRWYYPATPLYDCPRSEAYVPEHALRRPSIPAGWKLAAFVARPIGRDSVWGALADSLNPDATADFIQRAYEPYARSLGEMFGRQIPAIFTDEPKYHHPRPWTAGIFEDFQRQFGYDLRPRLEHLFDPREEPGPMLTRLHFRQWCGERFADAWLKPIAKWCREHKLALVGHISPEDDVVQQAACVTNLMPLQRELAMPGIDLIVPAVGDAQHAILNVGAACAVSVEQQTGRSSVMSETLGASGLHVSGSQTAKVLAWQVVSGVGTIVVHAAFSTTLGLRRIDAPPDFGPDSERFNATSRIDHALRPLQDFVRDSKQIAPVAILWPIRSFQTEVNWWKPDDEGDRKQFNQLLLKCLENQIGVQIVDEADLIEATCRDGKLCVGQARYETLLLPSLSILHENTVKRLTELHAGGFPVYATGKTARWKQETGDLTDIESTFWKTIEEKQLLAKLPRLLPISGDGAASLRLSAWEKNGQTTYLLMNLAEDSVGARIGEERIELRGGRLIALQRAGARLKTIHQFDSQDYEFDPVPKTVELIDWAVRWPGRDWQPIDRPRAVYELQPPLVKPEGLVQMVLTGNAPVGPAVVEHLDFRARLASPARRATLILEPTAHRGNFTVTARGRKSSHHLRDTDPAAVNIELADGSDDVIEFRIHNPTPFDGIKLAPTVRIES